jgi:hypothetical protein
MAKGKHIKIETTVENALSAAGSDVNDLKDEMDSWRDGMEDKFSSTEKYERVSEAADGLENADLESHCEALVTALQELSEGRPFVAGCPEHVVGTPCPLVKKCSWKGEMHKRSNWGRQTVIRHNPPQKKTQTWEQGSKKVKKTTTYFGSIGNQYWCVDEPSTPKEREETQAAFEIAAKKAEEENLRIDTPFIPARIANVPETFPVAGLEDLCDAKVSYVEFQPYKGKGLSRANRLGNAITAAQAAIEVVQAKLEEAGGDPRDEGRIRTATDAVEEVESAIGELEGIEFPGMYG